MSELGKILADALDEQRFVERFVTDKVGNLRDGSEKVVKAYDEANSIFKTMKDI